MTPQVKEKEIPKYVVIADMLQSEIEEGKYPVNERLPSESDLCRRFHVNRYVIRHALDLLMKMGVIRSHQGKGHFVCERPFKVHYTITPETKYSDVITKLGRKPRVAVLEKDLVEAPSQVAEYLRLLKGEQVYRLILLRYADHIPISYNLTWLNARFLPDFLLHASSFHSLYELIGMVYHLRLQRIWSSFKTAFPSMRESLYLDIPPSTNLLNIESVMKDDRENLIEFTSAKYRGDLCEVSVQFGK